MINVALFGAGRIGAVHGRTIADSTQARLVYVSDPIAEAAGALGKSFGAETATADAVLSDAEIEAVIIASSTDTHADLIEAAARAGKAVFCEKPIHLDAARARESVKIVEAAGVPLAIGFNRRFDPHFAAFKQRLEAGAIGELELLSITSRDPKPPPLSYIRVSGGLFRDMMIHDFDLARWFLGEEPVEVFAYGSCLFDPSAKDAGDVDTAIVNLRTESGRLCQISNSRRAVYGYDQRLEAHGSRGMLRAENPRPTVLERSGEDGVVTDRMMDFFLVRYADSYRIELEHFFEGIAGGEVRNPTGDDGLRALLLADAATESRESGRAVAVTAP